MTNCKTCKRAIFDAKFGLYKCSETKNIVPGSLLRRTTFCKSYVEGKPQESKDNKAYYQDMDYKENEE